MSRGGGPIWVGRLEELGVKSLLKAVFAVIGLLLLLVFVAVIPGVDRVVPGLPVTFGAVVSALVTLFIVVLLLRVATTASGVISAVQFSVPGVADRAAGVAYWTILFLAVVIAYEGFGSAVEPAAAEAGILWAYDLAFFLLGVVPLVLVGYYLFRLLDPMADLVVTKLHVEAQTEPATVQTALPTGPEGFDEAESETGSERNHQ